MLIIAYYITVICTLSCFLKSSHSPPPASSSRQVSLIRPCGPCGGTGSGGPCSNHRRNFCQATRPRSRELGLEQRAREVGKKGLGLGLKCTRSSKPPTQKSINCSWMGHSKGLWLKKLGSRKVLESVSPEMGQSHDFILPAHF